MSYVRTLAGAFKATQELVENLTTLTKYAKGVLLSSHILEDIFASFLENNRFEDAEAKCLQKLLHAMSTDFMQVWQTKKASKRNATLMNQNMVSATAQGVQSMAQSMTSNLLNAAGRTVSPDAATQKMQQSHGEKMFISSDLTISFFDALEESEHRIQLICLPEKVPTVMAKQFSIFCDKILVSMLDFALDVTLDDVSTSWDGRSEPDGRPLKLILNVTQVSSAIQRHFEQFLVAYHPFDRRQSLLF